MSDLLTALELHDENDKINVAAKRMLKQLEKRKMIEIGVGFLFLDTYRTLSILFSVREKVGTQVFVLSRNSGLEALFGHIVFE